MLPLAVLAAVLTATAHPAVVPAVSGAAGAAGAQVRSSDAGQVRSSDTGQVRIPAGEHVPFYGDGRAVRIAAFLLDRLPVTQAGYLEFVRAQPRWRRDAITPAFADDRYLADWRGALELEPGAGDRPVVHVSWFAARAYCAWRGGRLPALDEWEYVAAASETQLDAARDAGWRQRLLVLYTQPRPATPPAVGSGFRNAYGVSDLHGWQREWVADFNNVMLSDDSRGTATQDRQLYCAAAASSARDALDYAAFLRFSYRASLSGRATLANLGFRCARSIP
jgi:formylglycine-generating enzyme